MIHPFPSYIFQISRAYLKWQKWCIRRCFSSQTWNVFIHIMCVSFLYTSRNNKDVNDKRSSSCHFFTEPAFVRFIRYHTLSYENDFLYNVKGFISHIYRHKISFLKVKYANILRTSIFQRHEFYMWWSFSIFIHTFLYCWRFASFFFVFLILIYLWSFFWCSFKMDMILLWTVDLVFSQFL